MSITWSGEQLLEQVETALRDAGAPALVLDLKTRLAVQRSLETALADFVDIMVCSECGAALEYGEPE